jgi:hypothetical protein
MPSGPGVAVGEWVIGLNIPSLEITEPIAKVIKKLITASRQYDKL